MKLAAQSITPDVAWKQLVDLAVKDENLLVEPNYNGFKFCARFSIASGATVRAAWQPQVQDRRLRARQLIGDWEGFVFDFKDGGLERSYLNLERPQAGKPLFISANLQPTDGAAGRNFHQSMRLA
jgi:hypothetical protein